jgi:hypothetical protein
MPALRLGDILRLRNAGTKLHSCITISIYFATGNDLIAFERQDGDGHMAAIILEQAGHSHFLRDHASTHDQISQ